MGGNPISRIYPYGLLTSCEMVWLNNTYGTFGGFLTDLFNVQQYIPGQSDDLEGSLITAGEVGAEKLIGTTALAAAGNSFVWRNSAVIGSDIAGSTTLRIGGALASGLASAILEVTAAGLAPFATLSLGRARVFCKTIEPSRGCK